MISRCDEPRCEQYVGMWEKITGNESRINFGCSVIPVCAFQNISARFLANKHKSKSGRQREI